MLRKIYRKIFDVKNHLLSQIRIWHLRLKYPSIKISGKSYIGKNCQIICVDGGRMELQDVHINYGCFIFCGENATLKIKKSYIGMNSVVVATKEIVIEKNCEIAEMVVVRDQNHNHNFTDTPIAQQGMNSIPIYIGSNVWIGAKATILKGVTIGKNSIIGANAVVTKDIPEKSVAIGVPAKIIKSK